MANPSKIPSVPVKHADFIAYVHSHPDKPVSELLAPFKNYDAKLREVFAQEADHPALTDQHLNIVPVFAGHEKDLKIRARKLGAESQEEKERYVMPLDEETRRSDGSPAIVESMEEFQQNFSLFCESSLVDLDWSNVVAAGSSVVTCLLPTPPRFKKSKRVLREYYHEIIAPASDIDLFIYGLSEEEAIKKIIQIEQGIKDSILTETTTIRTKNAITIASQYPTRHIQIVLRIYKSVAEILTGFDVDCSCAAYDGQQVYASPRALAAYMTQTNTIDLTRRSPSYESRLSKYSHRGFEVYWPLLDRTKIDPTIFERNFGRTVGLARLLVLERLPTKSERESYMDERRRERGRPALNRYREFGTSGNIKDKYEDEIAEWVEQEDVSDYHTFTIPYGPTYNAKKIEKMLYTKDLLLNAEWNKRDTREVNLHRHPAFFGFATDVIEDCCGFCPEPVTPEEHDIAEVEAKIYVSGNISFIKDDPGRQAIGSFNPITDDDWTEMAYVGNTARLCQAIIDGDQEHVEDWLSQEGSDPNTRDYTGRTPLHLAVISSTPEIVGALINHGARLVARLADGRTALHLAAARGSVEMVKMILQKSEQNEEEEAKKEEIRKQARQAAREGKANPEQTTDTMDVDGNESETQSEDSDIEMVDGPDSDEDMRSTTTGSYVKIKEEKKESDDLVVDDQDEDEPDVYDVNVLAWDTQCSALHYAILNGHRDVVKELVQTFGADVLLPIKLMHSHDKSPRGAILTLVLALELPLENAKAMVQTLLEIGASSAQADTNQTTALHYISGTQPEVLEMLFHHDEPSAKRAINHLAVPGSSWSPWAQSPLMSAIVAGNSLAAMKLLEAGAEPIVDFKAWLKSVSAQHDDVAERDSKRNHDDYVKDVEQPIILAALAELPELVIELLERGVDPNTLPKGTQQALVNEYHHNPRESLLDIVRKRISQLRNYKDDKPPGKPEHKLVEGVNYLESIEPGTYKEFIAKIHLNSAQDSDKRGDKAYEDQLKEYNERTGIKEKQEAIDAMAVRFKELEQELVRRGAKTYKELYPEEDAKKEKDTHHYNRSWSPRPDPPFSIFFDFNVYDLENDTREAYCKLFQAAWDADLDTIKSLTLAPWGPSGKNKPLKIAVEDRDDQSPFSIAMLRGHTDVARAIVEIAFAQYQPETEEKKVQYRMGNEDEEDDDEDDEGSASSDVPVHQQTVSVNFTVDNIGEVSTQVKSKTSPLSYIAWTCTAWTYKKMYHPDQKFIYGVDGKTVRGSGHLSLIAWAITTNDWSLFAFMLDLNIEWAGRLKKDSDPDASAIPNTFSESDFLLAIKFGRLDMLAKMISHNGAGMQLASLVRRSGVKYQEKPRFYQGLSVHGKKRADWVSAARGTTMYTVSDSNPPLLHAAFKGSLSSVEWFLSDAPSRHYKEFANTYKDDKLINHLNTVGGGFDKVLSKWLGARREIALHCAVLATPTPEATKLIAYLIQAMPDSINIKSRDGYSPLALAFSLRRLEAAKLLIAAGADQTVRDSNKANLLHYLLVSPYTNTYLDWGIQDFLDLLDKRLIPSLLVERCSNDPGSLTPLARWLRTSPQDADVLRLLLDFAKPHGNQHLEMLDGSGDTPLHYVVTSRRHSDLKIMLEYRPELLYRENSVGRTPYELAADAHIASVASSTPNVTSRSPPMSIVNHHPEKFLKQDSEDEAANNETIWRICERHMQEHPGKRKLVSLLDANEVAKRLANRYGGSRQNGLNVGEEIEAGSDDGNEDTQDYTDEVSAWYHLATQPKPGR